MGSVGSAEELLLSRNPPFEWFWAIEMKKEPGKIERKMEIVLVTKRKGIERE